MAGCRWERHWVCKSRPGLANHAMADLVWDSLQAVGAPRWDEQAKAKAREIQSESRPRTHGRTLHRRDGSGWSTRRRPKPSSAVTCRRHSSIPPPTTIPTCPGRRRSPASISPALPSRRHRATAIPVGLMNALGGMPETIDPMVSTASKVLALSALRLIEDADARKAARDESRPAPAVASVSDLDPATLRLRSAHPFPLARICRDPARPRLVDTDRPEFLKPLPKPEETCA